MAKYNPNNQYKWEEDTDFTLSGSEFGIIMNTFRSILRTTESQQVLMINAANEAVESVMKRQVETGLIREVKPESDIPSMTPVREEGDMPKNSSKENKPSTKK